MAGLSAAEEQATLDARFPTSGATDYIGYSVNGTSEWSGLARTPVGATGWKPATQGTPGVPSRKAIASLLTSAAATAQGTVSHFAIFPASTGGTQRTDWQAFAEAKPLAVGDKLTHAVDAIGITLD